MLQACHESLHKAVHNGIVYRNIYKNPVQKIAWIKDILQYRSYITKESHRLKNKTLLQK